jgi:hypothetical protein
MELLDLQLEDGFLEEALVERKVDLLDQMQVEQAEAEQVEEQHNLMVVEQLILEAELVDLVIVVIKAAVVD